MSEPVRSEDDGATGLIDATVVHRDGTVVFEHFTLLARRRELLVVLGPSGSGKTTALRAIAGLTPLRSGRVVIAGATVPQQTYARDLAMVFEQTSLMPFLDVAGNMAFGLKAHGVDRPEARRRVEAEAKGLRLSRLLSRRPDGLSFGERGQVGIGRALVRNPKAFLLDEPLAHLDAGERGRMRRLIAEAIRSAGVGALYVTHDQADALAIGDRVAVINDGRLVQLGSPRELYDEPADVFVAGFVGQPPMGMVPARLVEAHGLAGYQVGFRTLPTWRSVPAALRAWVGRPVILGLRPQDVTDAAPGADPDFACLNGVVRVVERTGRDTFATVRVGDHQLTARFSGRTPATVGEQVMVAVDAAQAHVFDPATGRALAHPSVDVAGP